MAITTHHLEIDLDIAEIAENVLKLLDKDRTGEIVDLEETVRDKIAVGAG